MANSTRLAALNERLYPWLVWLLRIAIGATFIFSGFTKEVDPWGFVYKIEDYLNVWGIQWIWREVVVCVAMAASGCGVCVRCAAARRLSPPRCGADHAADHVLYAAAVGVYSGGITRGRLWLLWRGIYHIQHCHITEKCGHHPREPCICCLTIIECHASSILLCSGW